MVIAVISESNSSLFSFNFFTKDSMARLENGSGSPPWRWHIKLWTIDKQASADVGVEFRPDDVGVEFRPEDVGVEFRPVDADVEFKPPDTVDTLGTGTATDDDPGDPDDGCCCCCCDNCPSPLVGMVGGDGGPGGG